MAHGGVDPNALGQWLQDGKLALDLFRSSIGFLPKGPEREKVEAQVGQAEEALKRSEASLAKELGFHLCKCTFPPQIMLWKEAERTNICGNCGHIYPPKPTPRPSRRGSGWI